jgi:hypothetical protein
VTRVCAAHRSRLYERIDAQRDTSGLRCFKGDHWCSVWLVCAEGGQVVAKGSLHSGSNGEHIVLDEDYFAPMKPVWDSLVEWLYWRKPSHATTELAELGDVVSWKSASEMSKVYGAVSTKRCHGCGRKCVRMWVARKALCNRCRSSRDVAA